jgi:hypothetical protein
MLTRFFREIQKPQLLIDCIARTANVYLRAAVRLFAEQKLEDLPVPPIDVEGEEH